MTTPTGAIPSPHPRPFLLVQTRPEDDAAAAEVEAARFDETVGRLEGALPPAFKLTAEHEAAPDGDAEGFGMVFLRRRSPGCPWSRTGTAAFRRPSSTE